MRSGSKDFDRSYFERFTPLLRAAVVTADRSVNPGQLDGSALLRGLLELSGGSAVRALESAGIDGDTVGLSEPSSRKRRSARETFAAAGKYADALHDPLVRTGHLLLAVLDQRPSSAGLSLSRLAARRQREHVLELLAEDRARGEDEAIPVIEVTISDELPIPFPPDLVWSLIAPIENVALFLAEGQQVQGARRLAGAVGMPDQEQYLIRTEGKDVLYASEIVEEVPGRRAVMRDVGSPPGYESRLNEWELSPSGTATLLAGRLTLRVIAPVRSAVQQAEDFHRDWLHNYLRRVGELLAAGWRPE